MPMTLPSQCFRALPLISLSLLLRVILLIYGLYQDAHSPLPYTDIDYHVFTSAARYVSNGDSPYARETYRYTPLLAWILLPTTWEPQWLWFQWGKVLFALADLAAGWLIIRVLMGNKGQKHGSTELEESEIVEEGSNMSEETAGRYASLWLLNPMVATISTRGSAEGLLGLLSAALVSSTLSRRTLLSGFLLGLGVHFKIYPFIYGPTILLHLSSPPPHKFNTATPSSTFNPLSIGSRILTSKPCLLFLAAALSTFAALNIAMYLTYGPPFLDHTFLYHLTRIDHRHNFSPYNTLLHHSSMRASSPSPSTLFPTNLSLERLAFLPQLLLSALLIPLTLRLSHPHHQAQNLPTTLLAQTFAFVAFNKVVTSQYFLWYLIYLPLYLPHSSFLRRPKLGLLALGLWVGGQAAWLQQGYALEFLGQSTFFPGLWAAGLGFFAVNCWVLGIIVGDIGGQRGGEGGESSVKGKAQRAERWDLVQNRKFE